MGLLIDTSCTVWEEPCGEGTRGACWLYDTTSFSLKIVALAVTQKLLGIINVAVALRLYKPPLPDTTPMLALEVNVEGEEEEVNREEAETQGQAAAAHTPDVHICHP